MRNFSRPNWLKAAARTRAQRIAAGKETVLLSAFVGFSIEFGLIIEYNSGTMAVPWKSVPVEGLPERLNAESYLNTEESRND